ncbi:hypothetical protein M0R72_02160 [Candidatus Pacearchaeota archaeon]|jgi:hypothetical protein|nr:hypothetical protein [Candidatus Pacearchaeota archaeon]
MSKFDIATEMNGIIASPVYQNIFAKPQLTKTAAAKDADKAKAEKEKAKAKADKEKEAEKAAKEKAKEKADKEKAKEKAEKEKAKAKATKKKAMTKYESCIYSLCKASEILDEAGLGKASSYALLALDDLIKTAAKKKEEKEKGKGKDKKNEEEDKKAAEKKKEDAKKKEDKGDAKGLPPWLNKGKKDGKKDEKSNKDEKKKVKKASDEIDCDTGMAEDDADNKDFEELMAELDEPSEEGGDWDVLNKKPEELEDIDVDDPELEALVEGIEGADVPEEGLDSFHMNTASKKTSLQKLAEELSKSFLT